MSAHPDHAGISGTNPNYYNQPTELPANVPAELAGDDGYRPHPLQSNPVGVVSPQGTTPAAHHQQYNQSPMSTVQEQTEKQEGFFPPPPSTGHEQQQYYPPPPPGPPPAASHGEQQYFPPPPPGPPPNQAYAHAAEPPPDFPPPPSYSEEFGQGPEFVDEKLPLPPNLPPRPSSSSGPQFPPPPKSPSQAPAQAPAQAQSTTGASSSSSKHGGFGQKLYQWGIKAGGPINKLTNKLGSEAFWPTTMDKECDKAARILKSFCKDGFYTTKSQHPAPSPGDPKSPGPSGESKVLVKIPTSAIANAKGLAIFTTFRTGLHISGAGGSGVVVARLPDGSWSPPAGFLVHTLGAGFMIGLDIYDCVCVLNTQSAVDAFARRARVSLGGELAVVAGPVGAGGGLETAFGGKSAPKKESTPNPGLQAGSSANANANARPKSSGGCENKPVWSYMKSRGFYAGIQADGTVIVARQDANAAFYGEREISVEKILKGQVNLAAKGKESKDLVMWPEGGRQLSEVLKAAEGKGADANIIKEMGDQPTPGDLAPPSDGVGAHQGHSTGTGTGAGTGTGNVGVGTKHMWS
ncbi:hypothetical protein HD806DRAFT_471646 [Xylariaceae sp. AK1471]|nr:hypothetical protein HD806DRAFT_471646 [Xylariaceae sp. AK1471]